MPIFNVVKVRTDTVDLIIEADTYEEAMKIASNTPVEFNQVDFGEWEIDIQLGGEIEE